MQQTCTYDISKVFYYTHNMFFFVDLIYMINVFIIKSTNDIVPITRLEIILVFFNLQVIDISISKTISLHLNKSPTSVFIYYTLFETFQ